MRLSFLVAASLLCAALSAGEATAEARRYLNQKDLEWVRKPTGNDLARLYPKVAQRKGLSGYGVSHCRVKPDGWLDDCRIVAESPEGVGFGESVLQLSALFQARSRTAQSIEGGYVTIPILLRVPRADGRNAVVDRPDMGSQTYLLKPGAHREPTIGCPTETEPDRRCSLESLTWEDSPDWGQMAALARGAGLKSGITVVECSLETSGALTNCGVAGAASAEAREPLLELMRLYHSPRTLEGKAITKGGIVAARFDWARLNEVLETTAPLAADSE